jgi:hypothetical protein
MLIQVRKNWSLLLLYLVLALLIPFMNSVASLHYWALAAAPFAAFHSSAYLYLQNRKIPLLLFLLTLAFIFIQQYATPLWQ